jgi:hypothetical protein
MKPAGRAAHLEVFRPGKRESMLALSPAAAKILRIVPSIKVRRNEQSSMRQIVQQHFPELQ